MANSWLKTDAFVCRKQHPNYIEEHHLVVMGLRSDSRVFYAIAPVPLYEPNSVIRAERKLAIDAIKERFDSYLADEGESQLFTESEYDELLSGWLKRNGGVLLDEMPWSEA